MLTQDTLDAMLFRRLGASRLARTVCAAPTGAANQALYGKMPSVAYQDYPQAQLIVLWGVNPSASGIHLVPYLREAQTARREARRRSIRGRRRWRAQADLHLAVASRHRRGGRAGACIATCSRAARRPGVSRRAHDRRGRAARTGRAVDLRARGRGRRRRRRGGSQRFAELYARASPALVRCGWGLERNRNGGNAAMAVLALPAVGGKFGVRGGGYAMSNSASWGIERHVARATRSRRRASST